MKNETSFQFSNLNSKIFILAVLIVIGTNLTVNAQSCRDPPVLGEVFAWVKYSSVRVNIDPAFNASQRTAIQETFNNWAGVAGSAVSFSFTSGTYIYQVNYQNPTSCSACQAEAGGTSSGGRRYSAFTNIHTGVTDPTALKQAMSHEIGHTFGLDDCSYCSAGTSAMTATPSLNDTTYGRDNPSACDSNAAVPYYQSPEPTPTPGGCNGSPDYNQYPTTGCASGFVASGGTCTRSNDFISRCDRFGGYNFEGCGCFGDCADGGSCSPVVIDVNGNGFNLTDALNGVNFDVDGNGTLERRAWTSINSDDAWLVLDRNGNGTIDGGKEMFGSITSQAPPPDGVEFNGFNALAQYDEAGFGGNGDGQIESQDSIFSSLRLWQDANHNGVSESDELHSLTSLGVGQINLKYKESKRVDQHGNQFKYRSKVLDTQGAQVGRWAWDVFLVTQ